MPRVALSCSIVKWGEDGKYYCHGEVFLDKVLSITYFKDLNSRISFVVLTRWANFQSGCKFV